MTKLLTAIILLSMIGSVVGQSTQSQTDKIKAVAAKYSSSGSTVEVKMLSGSKNKGKISGVADETFSFAPKSGQSMTIRYDEVAEIKKKGGLGTGAIIGIVAAGVGAAILTGVFLVRCRNELGCGAGR